MNPEQRAVSRRIKKALAESEIDVPTLADLCGVSAPAVYQWFSRGTISKTHLPTVARATGKTVYYFLTGDGDEGRMSERATTLARGFDKLPSIDQNLFFPALYALLYPGKKR